MEILPKVSKGGRKLQNYSLLFFLSSSSENMVNFVDEKFWSGDEYRVDLLSFEQVARVISTVCTPTEIGRPRS